MKVTILGCGSSGGVPLVTGDWGTCDPANSKNHRRRASVLIEVDEKKLLIDTTPDLRMQMLDTGTTHVDAVLYTHTHADHCHGIDELRQVYNKTRKAIPAFGSAETMDALTTTFPYVFKTMNPAYPNFLAPHVIESTFKAADVPVVAFDQNHGPDHLSTGYRVENVAYSTDLSDLPEASYEALKGLDLWIVDCLRDKPHISHAHYEKTMKMIERVQPKQAILTHMTQFLDYEELSARLPGNIKVAYDGMVVTL